MDKKTTQWTDEVVDVVNAVHAIAECIRVVGEIPSGHLYARLMDKMDIHSYNLIISTLVRVKLIRQEPSHLLVWIGPRLES